MVYCIPCGVSHKGQCENRRKRDPQRITRQHSGPIMEGKEDETDNPDIGTEELTDAEEAELIEQLKQEKLKARKLQLKRQLKQLQSANTNEEAEASHERTEEPPGGGGSGRQPPGNEPWRYYDEVDVSPTRQAKRRSKFDLSHYMNNTAKDSTFASFVLASMKWGTDYDWQSVEEVQGFMSHLGYLAMKAEPEIYIAEAIVDFDSAVRCSADRRGPSAFSGGNSEISNLHFGYEKTVEARRARDAAKARNNFQNKPPGGGRGGGVGGGRGRGQQFASTRRGSCYTWNLEKECTDKACQRYHTCLYCWDPAHRAPACKDRNSTAFKMKNR